MLLFDSIFQMVILFAILMKKFLKNEFARGTGEDGVFLIYPKYRYRLLDALSISDSEKHLSQLAEP